MKQVLKQILYNTYHGLCITLEYSVNFLDYEPFARGSQYHLIGFMQNLLLLFTATFELSYRLSELDTIRNSSFLLSK